MPDRYDLILRGGACVLPWGVEQADVGVRGGRIAAIGDLRQRRGRARRSTAAACTSCPG